MSKQAAEIVITEAVNFLAAKHGVPAIEIARQIESGNLNLIDSLSALIKTGFEIAA